MTPQAVDHFVAVPLRFVEALTAGDLDSAHFTVGILVAHRCYEVRNTAGGVATVRLANLADLCDLSDDTIERKLDGLRARGWIDFERPKQGQRIGWRIWLKGLALDGKADGTSAPPPHDLRATSAQTHPSVRRSSSAEEPGGGAAIPHGKRDRSSAPPPQVDSAEPTDDTTRHDKREGNYLSEEGGSELPVASSVTGCSPEGDRFLEVLCELNGGPPVRVVAGEDGALEWSQPPREGEAGIVADAQALVDARIARWIGEGLA